MTVVFCVFVKLLLLSVFVDEMSGLYCGHSTYKSCPDGSGCYHPYDLCDGEMFCKDNFDEDPDMCKEYTCRKDHMKCRDGKQCIHRAYACDFDGYPKCNDGSDEDPEFCKDFQCMEEYYIKCNDGITCASSQSRCP